MSVTHTVLFQFKEDADPEAVKAVRVVYSVLHLSFVAQYLTVVFIAHCHLDM